MKRRSESTETNAEKKRRIDPPSLHELSQHPETLASSNANNLVNWAAGPSDELFYKTLNDCIATSNPDLTIFIAPCTNSTLLVLLLRLQSIERFLNTLESFYNHLGQESTEKALMMVIAWAYKESVEGHDNGNRILEQLPRILAKRTFATEVNFPSHIDEAGLLSKFSIFHAYALFHVEANHSLQQALKAAYQQLIVEAGRHDLLTDATGQSPLYVAHQTKRVKTISAVYQNVKVDLFADLMFAYQNQDNSYIRYLNGQGINFETAVDANGNTALHDACRKGDEGLILRFLENRSFPLPRNNSGLTPCDLLPTHLASWSSKFVWPFVDPAEPYEPDALFEAIFNRALEGIARANEVPLTSQHIRLAFYFATDEIVAALIPRFDNYSQQIKLAKLAADEHNYFVLRRMQKFGLLENLLQNNTTRFELPQSTILQLCLVEFLSVSCYFESEEDIAQLIAKKAFVIKALLLAGINYSPFDLLYRTYIDQLFAADDGKTLVQISNRYDVSSRLKNLMDIIIHKRVNIFASFLTTFNLLSNDYCPIQLMAILNLPDADKRKFLFLLASMALSNPRVFGVVKKAFASEAEGVFLDACITIVPQLFSFQRCKEIIEFYIDNSTVIHLHILLKMFRLMPQFPEWDDRAQLCSQLLLKVHLRSLKRGWSSQSDRAPLHFLKTILLGLGADNKSVFRETHLFPSPAEKVAHYKQLWQEYSGTPLETVYRCEEEYNARVVQLENIRSIYLTYYLVSMQPKGRFDGQIQRLSHDLFLLNVCGAANISPPFEALCTLRSRGPDISDVIFMCDNPCLPPMAEPSKEFIEAQNFIREFYDMLAIDHKAFTEGSMALHCLYDKTFTSLGDQQATQNSQRRAPTPINFTLFAPLLPTDDAASDVASMGTQPTQEEGGPCDVSSMLN